MAAKRERLVRIVSNGYFRNSCRDASFAVDAVVDDDVLVVVKVDLADKDATCWFERSNSSIPPSSSKSSELLWLLLLLLLLLFLFLLNWHVVVDDNCAHTLSSSEFILSLQIQHNEHNNIHCCCCL